ncbi:BRO-N domain-containing protein [Streptomyces smyrnaeus]|uniref:BRO-N domain-containing protein n=1 Tax=Streptomyces smyrnaeus TaxID=1387713 RepID=UPI0033E3D447
MTMTMVSPPDDPGENRAIQRFANNEFDIDFLPDGGNGFAVVASGVARALGFRDAHRLVESIPDDEKGYTTTCTPGGNQQVWLLKEPGFYRAIGQRQADRIKDEGVRDQVKRFQSWVYADVLPSLRKHGRYEVAPPPPTPKEISSAAGPLPYREQAEIAVILRPVLPEAYASAMGKVILSRAMGERPELEPSETPLYAATFLAEKGHRPKTVAKFQSSFGSRVSNRYFKVHGRRPEKIPGPAGSRIDKVAVYSEDDRPLLEQVYGELRERIEAFEGGQAQLPPAA